MNVVTKRSHWLLVLFVVVASAPAQDLRYIEYDTDLLPGTIFKARREAVMHEIGNDAIAVFYASPERLRNGDVEYAYRQDDNLYYLTGFPEPNAILVLIPGGVVGPKSADAASPILREILFVQKRDLQREQWTGRRYGPEGAMVLRGLDYALPNEQFGPKLSEILASVKPKRGFVPAF